MECRVKEVSTDKDFSRRLFEKLVNAGVTLFTYVPDLGNADIIEIAKLYVKKSIFS